MKSPSFLAASLLAALGALSFTVRAADAPAQPAQEPVKQVKPHSHVEEKTGAPQAAPGKKAAKPNAAKDRSKHFHPRDMK